MFVIWTYGLTTNIVSARIKLPIFKLKCEILTTRPDIIGFMWLFTILINLPDLVVRTRPTCHSSQKWTSKFHQAFIESLISGVAVDHLHGTHHLLQSNCNATQMYSLASLTHLLPYWNYTLPPTHMKKQSTYSKCELDYLNQVLGHD